MRKQSGFTLIELMVVMAIIAILATAGIAAYGGYIKKARDTTRIADLRAIESVIMGYLTLSGNATDLPGLIIAIKESNNNKLIEDPLVDTGICIEQLGNPNLYTTCFYSYAPCNDGGYILRTTFESESNVVRYIDDPLNAHGDIGLNSPLHYDLGSCSSIIGGGGPEQITE